jgi:hypothetical protein
LGSSSSAFEYTKDIEISFSIKTRNVGNDRKKTNENNTKTTDNLM